jgi:formylglycine-generating enzyme required for sulfatase activity
MEFVRIPAGTFQMGCHEAAGKCDLDEGPPRMVRLDDFWIGKYEVTQGQWRRIMRKNPSQYPRRRSRRKKPSRSRARDRYPVEMVSWRDAQNFIRRLNRQSSGTFRLPSEAEWEYACRAEGKPLRFGTAKGKLTAKSGNYEGAGDGYRFTAPVGKYAPNALGLYDMSGNVLEWVQDNYSENYKGAATENPIHVGSGPGRGGRGGSWNTGFQRNLRCTHRDSFDPSVRYGYLGFRLVRVR